MTKIDYFKNKVEETACYSLHINKIGLLICCMYILRKLKGWIYLASYMQYVENEKAQMRRVLVLKMLSCRSR